MAHSSVPDISLVLACYNEEKLFRESVSRIVDVLDHSIYSYEIIFVDDKSTDRTPALIAAFASKHRRVTALYHDRNRGRGETVKDGMLCAKGKVVGYIDIDCEVSPVYIPSIVTRILARNADGVIGKRYYRTSPGSLLREVLSRGYQRLSDVIIGTGGLDTESGYKFFNRRKIIPIIRKTTHPGWFWDTEIMVYALQAGLKIVEEPVLFLRRFDKTSSVHIVRDTLDYVVQLIRFRALLRSRGS